MTTLPPLRTFLSGLLLLTVSGFATSVNAEDELAPPKTTMTHPEIDGELPLVFQEGFEKTGAKMFTPTDPKAWKIVTDDGSKVYHLFVRKSNYTPPVRSPYNRSLVNGVTVSDFILDVKFKSTSKPYNHQSLCLFFGFQDASHFHYVHFGKKADPHANQIFIVNDAPRKAISLTTTDGTPWDDQWHQARIVRNTKTGTISVYFDDMDKPVMTAKDTTFTFGQVGVGSFDDPGMFDDLRLYGTVVDTTAEKEEEK